MIKLTLLIPLLSAFSAVAQPPPDIPLATLQGMYWDCDHASTSRMLSMGEGEECSIIYEALKMKMFNGNYPPFYSWWKENKDAEYKKRQSK